MSTIEPTSPVHIVRGQRDDGLESYCVPGYFVTFPEPSGLQINMMPFMLAAEFAATGLPEYCRAYFEELVAPILATGLTDQAGKVCYLSIDEREVAAGKTHRRSGLHTEASGPILPLGDGDTQRRGPASARGGGDSSPLSYIHQWGKSTGHLQGGIYLASNFAGTTAAWDCQIIPDPDTSREIIGPHGDIEHLRPLLPEPRVVFAKELLYWITDRTPHESLPMPYSGLRQWFRLVTSEVSLWFRDHSTPNPSGIVPDPAVTRTVLGNKFDPTSLRFADSEHKTGNDCSAPRA